MNYSLLFLLLSVGLLTFVALNATAYMFAATIAYVLLCTGLAFRKVRRLHAAFMTVGIVFDLLIVLTLEFQRHAIATAVSFTLTPIQQLHVGFSTIATLLYLPTLFLGFKLLKKGGGLRKWHLKVALTAFFFRTLGFITMFALLKRNVE